MRSFFPLRLLKHRYKVFGPLQSLTSAATRYASTHIQLAGLASNISSRPILSKINPFFTTITLPWFFWGYSIPKLTLLINMQSFNYLYKNVAHMSGGSSSAHVFTPTRFNTNRWSHYSWSLIKFRRNILKKPSYHNLISLRSCGVFRHPHSILWTTHRILRLRHYRIPTPHFIGYLGDTTRFDLLYKPIKRWRQAIKKRSNQFLFSSGSTSTGKYNTLGVKITQTALSAQFFRSLLLIKPYLRPTQHLDRITRRSFLNKPVRQKGSYSIRQLFHLGGISTFLSFTLSTTYDNSPLKFFLNSIRLPYSSNPLTDEVYPLGFVKFTPTSGLGVHVNTQTNLVTNAIINKYSSYFSIPYNSKVQANLSVYRSVSVNEDTTPRRVTKATAATLTRLLVSLFKLQAFTRFGVKAAALTLSPSYHRSRVFKLLYRRRWPILLPTTSRLHMGGFKTVLGHSKTKTTSTCLDINNLVKKMAAFLNTGKGTLPVIESLAFAGVKSQVLDLQSSSLSNTYRSFTLKLLSNFNNILYSSELSDSLAKFVNVGRQSPLLSILNKPTSKGRLLAFHPRKTPNPITSYNLTRLSLFTKQRRHRLKSKVDKWSWNHPKLSNLPTLDSSAPNLFSPVRTHLRSRAFSRIFRLRSKLINPVNLFTFWSIYKNKIPSVKFCIRRNQSLSLFRDSSATFLHNLPQWKSFVGLDYGRRGVGITQNQTQWLPNSFYIDSTNKSTFVRSAFFSVQYLLLWKLYPTASLVNLISNEATNPYKFFKFTQFKKTLFKRLLVRKHRLDSYRISNLSLRTSRYKQIGNVFNHNGLLSTNEGGPATPTSSLFPATHLYDLRSLFWSARPLATSGARSLLPKIKKTRFKPGYQRMWRLERSTLKEAMSLHHRYQYRLTTKIHLLYFAQRKKKSSSLVLRLDHTLILIHFASDFLNAKALVANDYVYLNGILATNANLVLCVNDFIQLLVNLRFYAFRRWFIGAAGLLFRKWTRRYYRTYRVRRQLFREFKVRSLASSVLNIQMSWYDVPKIYEVDYFTCSAFILYPTTNTPLSIPTSTNEKKISVLNMYNWKYIT